MNLQKRGLARLVLTSIQISLKMIFYGQRNVIRKDVVTNNEQNQILRSSSELINLEEQQKTILDEFLWK